ncbi:MAG: hypothetical protein NT099_06390 [Candidatus Saganbacteria bacterium]|nr:hypothetical protein [Candidatus Saganbacteria bacterium]
MIKKIIWSLLILMCLGTMAWSIPGQISFQGVLKDAAGHSVNDNLSIVFTIYDAASGGSSLWTETQSVSVEGGLYNVSLGASTPITATVFNGSTRYLGVKVSTDSEMTPRIALLSTPYAFRAAVVDTISDESVTTAKIVDAAVTNVKLAGSITGAKFATNISISTTGIVTADAFYGNGANLQGVTVANGAISSAKIATGAVTAEKIATSNSASSNKYLKYDGTNMLWATVSGGSGSMEVDNLSIDTNANGSLEVKDSGVTTAKLSNESVIAGKIAAGAVTSAKLASNLSVTGTVTAGAFSGSGAGLTGVVGTVADGSITAAKITNEAVTNGKIASNAITSAKITDEAVTSGKIAAGAVTSAKLASNLSVTGIVTAGAFSGSGSGLTNIPASSLADGSITAAKITDEAVTEGKIASSAVTAGKIAAGAVTSAKLASNLSVTGTVTAGAFSGSGSGLTNIPASSLADGSITAAKITDEAVTEGKIASSAVTAGKIAAGAVTSAKLASNLSVTGIVTAGAFSGSGSGLTNIPASSLADGSVTNAKLAGSISGDKLASNAAVLSIAKTGSSRLTGAVDLKPGTNITLTQTGNTIEVSASGGGSGTVTSISTGTGLTGGPITTSGIISIESGGIGATQLADNAVTAGKIAASFTSGQKYLQRNNDTMSWVPVSGGGSTSREPDFLTIGFNEFTSLEVIDDSITSTQIGAAAVTNAKLAGSIEDSKLNTITTAGKVSGSAITSGTIGGSKAINTTGIVTAGAFYGDGSRLEGITVTTAETVNGIRASTEATANQLLALDADKRFVVLGDEASAGMISGKNENSSGYGI